MRLSSLEVSLERLKNVGGVMKQTEFAVCYTCKCRLALAYVRYRDTAGNPYCHICYTRLLNG